MTITSWTCTTIPCKLLINTMQTTAALMITWRDLSYRILQLFFFTVLLVYTLILRAIVYSFTNKARTIVSIILFYYEKRYIFMTVSGIATVTGYQFPFGSSVCSRGIQGSGCTDLTFCRLPFLQYCTCLSETAIR